MLPCLPRRELRSSTGFGMRSGVSPPTRHQHKILKQSTLGDKHPTSLIEYLICKNQKNKAVCAPHRCTGRSQNMDSLDKLGILVLRRLLHSSQEIRRISTPRLNTLLCFHLVPINVVISHESQTIPNLRVGFPLRCFQRLSVPNLATRRCPWRDSR